MRGTLPDASLQPVQYTFTPACWRQDWHSSRCLPIRFLRACSLSLFMSYIFFCMKRIMTFKRMLLFMVCVSNKVQFTSRKVTSRGT